MSDIDGFQQLRNANIRRHAEWAKGGSVSLSFRGLEMAGECGEVCNELKKIERVRLGLAGGSDDLNGLKEELADVLICLDLIAMDLGIDLLEETKRKFDKTSVKFGLTSRFADDQSSDP
ncbi:MAG: MazG-like family protein [Planctomycetaceae bacterium]|nr:MazG-like family protein [Planctomycetaceae bacterium]